MLNASICTIGDEILIGQIVDTNSATIAKELNSVGVKVNKIISVQDDENEIISSIQKCYESSDIIIVTGGLGPTKDDITKKALAKLCNCEQYKYDINQTRLIEDICNKRNIALTKLNRDQALVPACCEVITNKLGTAPGMIFRINENNKNVILFSLPGVPYEMEHMLPAVIETVKNEFKIDSIYHRTLLTFGIPESTLASMIENWEDNLPDEIKLAYLPNPHSGVKLRLSIYGGDLNNNAQLVAKEVAKLKQILGNALYGEGDESLESVLSKYLTYNNKTISLAESCTSGRIASILTSIPGSSVYFKGGIIAYDNSIKMNILNVKEETLNNLGAVSAKCVEEMAENVRKLMKSDFSIATSGIAGPSGGSPDKPVGTVWIAISGPNFLESQMKIFNGNRQNNIERFSAEALNFLRLRLGLQLK
jgi:nicotinamide-nucleotide amidase